VFAKHVSSKELYASNALLRCATRILVPACSFTARSFSDLELACKRMAREDALLSSFLVPGARLRVRVHAAANSPLFHTSAVAERVARHLSLPAEPSFSRGSEGTGGVPEPPEQRLDVLVEGEWVKILVDASGDALHDRGWRMDRGAKMPLKESVAAGLLHAVGWVHSPAGLAAAATPEPASGFGALLDPFCGSGTIPIEAALLSIGMPAHFLSGRSFALQRWPSFEPGTWGAVTAEMGRRAARADQRRGRAPPIAASDRDAGAVSLARANAEAAGVADLVEFRHCAVSDVTPPRLRSSSGAATGKAQGGGVGKPGLLLTNPPWGVRSGTAQAEAAALDSLYWRIGQVCTRQAPRSE
jgi:23S rRNA G2445 N2-methylase RlmL